MIRTTSQDQAARNWLAPLLLAGWMGAVFAATPIPGVIAQERPSGAGAAEIDAAEIQALMEPASGAESDLEGESLSQPSGVDLLSLMVRGGGFMIPIGLMSLLVVTLAVERMISLRRRKLIPPKLVQGLRELSEPVDRFDPVAAYRLCGQYAGSAASRVISAMLLRTGQPLGEIERAASETVQREADDQASPIRWLTLAAAATPLMGLLGTVWGMIKAFHESTTLTPDRSRSEQLSEGIYTALVTTLAGLAVAIPAAILALYLENRLAKLFHAVEELAFEIAPGLVRFRGSRRLDADGMMRPIETTPTADASRPAPPPLPSKQRDGAKAG